MTTPSVTRATLDLSFRRLTASLIIGLTILAGLSATSFVILELSSRTQAHHADVVNAAGRQRYLMERTALEAVRFARVPNQGNRIELLESVEALSEWNLRLTSTPPLLSPEAQETARTSGMNLALDKFLSTARILSATADADARNRLSADMVDAAHGPMLAGFDLIVTTEATLAANRLDELRLVQRVTFGIMLAVILIEGLLVFNPLVRRVRNVAQKFYTLATRDHLTGSANRRHASQIGETNWAAARRYAQPMSVLMFDIDHFKTINDCYGHDAGDQAIVEFAALVHSMLRSSDTLGRWGGEEFVAILPNTPLEGAHHLAERIRKSVAKDDLRLAGVRVGFTVSIGVACIDPCDESFWAMIKRADDALYGAKASGRNRVELALAS